MSVAKGTVELVGEWEETKELRDTAHVDDVSKHPIVQPEAILNVQARRLVFPLEPLPAPRPVTVTAAAAAAA